MSDVLDDLPREWDYDIHVRGAGGVTIRAYDYEAPKRPEYVLDCTQVDPRETRDPSDLLSQIRLGLQRIATRREDRARLQDDDEREERMREEMERARLDPDAQWQSERIDEADGWPGRER